MKKDGELKSSPQSSRPGCSESVDSLEYEDDWKFGKNVNTWMNERSKYDYTKNIK